MDSEFIVKHWYAYIYEQLENQTNDVEFLLQVLNESQNMQQVILEVCCGGGRVCIPIARAGYRVVGFDVDEHMLLRSYRQMKNLSNLACYSADAVASDWGTDYDVVIMAGNIMINIESDMNNAQAQEIFITKAAKALRLGGHLYLDFDLHCNPGAVFNRLNESSYFVGADDLGTYGRTVSYGSVYNPVTQICTGANHVEITTNNGKQIVLSKPWLKHIPTQAQVYNWLENAGFSIERTYKNYTDEPLLEPIAESTHRATIWARKD